VADRLSAADVPYDGGKLIDLTIAGTQPQLVGAIIGDLMSTPDCDAVVMVVGSSARFRPEQAVLPLIEWVEAEKPLAVYLAPEAPESLRRLAEVGIAVFRTPEACADAVQGFLSWREPQPMGKPDPKLVASIAASLTPSFGPVVGEVEALELFRRLGISGPQMAVATDVEAAVKIAETIGYPVAIKIDGAGIAHKTEAGGVRLNIFDADGVRQAASDIWNNVSTNQSDANVTGLLVQQMQRGVCEAVVGYKRDALVGPTVTVGSGGILTELYRDFAVRLAPVTHEEALAMIDDVKGLAPARGYRGRGGGDVDALAEAIVALSAFAAIDTVGEAEINPLIVSHPGPGVVAVDGLIMRRSDLD
jgi:acyl-CoA synthetase (NDP forming)